MGANLPGPDGPPERTLAEALAALRSEGLALRRLSRFFRTPCFPAGMGPDYVNAAAVLAPVAGDGDVPDPARVLAALHRVEARFGRVRRTRWAGRSLDLDLLAVGGILRPDAAGQARWRRLPPERQREVAPDWRHPGLRCSVSEMAAALPRAARDEVVPL